MNLLDLLKKRGIQYKTTNNPGEILIKCTSGLHDDKNASLSYSLDKNIFNCWSCGFKGGIAKFLKSIGELETLELLDKHPYRITKLKDKLAALTEQSELHLPDDRKLYDDEFRDISSATYRAFSAFTTNELGLTDYLCVPIYQHDKLKFIEGRLLKNLDNQPKYNRQPAKVSVADILFPLDKIKPTNYVILVEGLFDMLNMWDLGYTNTLCIFGANNFNKRKAELLDNLGITRVDIMLDSDAAGRRGAEKIQELLDSRNIFARIITLPPGIDPGEITKKQLQRILQ